jgi:hypothetical protein
MTTEIEKARQRIVHREYRRDAGGVAAIVADNFTTMGLTIPRAHMKIAAAHAKALLDDGFEWETVVIAVNTALRRGQPNVVQYVALDLEMARAGVRMSRRDYERMLEDEMELR